MTDYQDPAEAEVDTTPRRAKLETMGDDHNDLSDQFVHLIASNGEPLMHSEILANGERGREAILRAMVDVLEQEGYVISPVDPDECAEHVHEPTEPVELMVYWGQRILENDGALSAGSSMDLDMAHDELTKAVRAYLPKNLAELDRLTVAQPPREGK